VADSPKGRGLIDTSVVIALGEVDPTLLPGQTSISALTLAELTSGTYAAPDEQERARRQNRLQRYEVEVESLPFDPDCARAYGGVYAAVRGFGRKARGTRVIDLMIAATALAHELPLYTLNPNDLRGLEGLIEIVDVSS
jgi:predicted nucleic acid-binding protein